MSIRIACVGGGPGGLFFSALVKRQLPDAEVVLFERNQADDVFGFGVVFSDATMQRIDDADPVLLNGLRDFGTHWDDIRVRVGGEEHAFAGNGMAAIHRKTLLNLLQTRAKSAGVDMRFGEFVGSLDELTDFELIVGADGANSLLRELVGLENLGHEVETASAKFIWFGTTHMFDGLTFVHKKNEHGHFAAHAYPISEDLSTFIVETDADTWQRAGLHEFDVSQPPGQSDLKTQHYLEALFADEIQEQPLVGNNSRWANFRTRRSDEHWHRGNVVFLGDAIHTAHFSVGSGTKMAMEDAVVLAREVSGSSQDLPGALSRYEKERMPQVAKVQNSARPSLSWWEHFGSYSDAFDPLQFTFHFFSRSITIEKIRQRDPRLVDDVEQWWRSKHGASPLQSALPLPHGTTLSSRNLWLIGDDSDFDSISDGTTTLPFAEGNAVLVMAPDDEHVVPEIIATLPSEPTVVVILGGTRLTRSLVSEAARLVYGHTTVIGNVEDAADAKTLILSGRTDAVASIGGPLGS